MFETSNLAARYCYSMAVQYTAPRQSIWSFKMPYFHYYYINIETQNRQLQVTKDFILLSPFMARKRRVAETEFISGVFALGSLSSAQVIC
jgi:hypothetical protein